METIAADVPRYGAADGDPEENSDPLTHASNHPEEADANPDFSAAETAAVTSSKPPLSLVLNDGLSSPPPPSPPRTSAANKHVLFIKTSDSPSSLHSERTRHQHARKVTRDIAALDFLQNIPMKADALHGHPSSIGGRAPPSPPCVAFQVTDVSMDDHTPSEGLAGRRLPGFEAKIVRLPPLFRYRLTTRFPASSAVVRRWESMTTQQGLQDGRVFFSRGCGYPIASSTLLKYDGTEKAATPHHHHHHHGARKRFLSVGNMEPQSYDWRGKSYYRLLHATWTPCDSDRDSQDDHPTTTPYVANYLDDPAFRQGRHRHVVRGDKNIGPVVSSILLFVKPHELKEELNKKFREKHTWLHDSELSLSKIRNLKRETLATGQRLDMEVATIALACVYFEKLVLSHYVNKANRKLYMSVCLLLAAKFNEPRNSDAMKRTIKQILAEIDVTHSLPSREVLTVEFKIYAQLSFSLHVPLAELQPHFTRLLKLIESNPRKYLDEDVFNDYSKLVLDEKNAASRALNDTVLSMDGETQDEGTDAEVLLSDEDAEVDVGIVEDDATRLRNESDTVRRRNSNSLPSWRTMPSLAQWWRERMYDEPIPARSRETSAVTPNAETKEQ